MMIFRTVLLGIALCAASVVQGSDIETLKQRCEAAREAKLAPERTKLIEECAAKPRNTRDYCERFYKDHGSGGKTQAGGYRQRQFHDLPECRQYYEAEKSARTR